MRWILLASAVCLPLPANALAAEAASPRVVVLELDGAVQPAALRYVERGLRLAEERGAALVVLELNTPGGTLVSLRSMTTAITGSRVPVAVHVTPAGARAASAGFFLLLAADVAAMAPGTNAGAAHPVAIGQEQREDDGRIAVELAKATEDAAALARSLAAARGRSVEWAERAVRESRSYSVEEARRNGLIEVVAADRGAVLRELEGRQIRRFDGTTVVLELRGAEIVEVDRTVAERLLMVIGDPQVAYFLLLLGMLGVMVELLHPGGVVPGVVGGLSLLLALYAFSVLPVSWVGVLLIAAGVGMMVAEAFVTSYGLLALGGIASFVVGSLMLIDTPIPGWRVSVTAVVPAALVLAAATLFLVSRALRAQRGKVLSGLEAMIGEVGELTTGTDGGHEEGKVFVHGEYWAAISPTPLPEGTKVRIERVEGRRLHVAPAAAAPG